MARKSRAAPATISQMLKMEAALAVKARAHYDAADKLRDYKERVKELGSGYTEVVDGVMHVIAIVPEKYGRGSELSIVKCKNG